MVIIVSLGNLVSKNGRGKEQGKGLLYSDKRKQVTNHENLRY